MYRDATGTWRRIDTALDQRGDSWHVRGDDRKREFAQSADADVLASVELSDGAVVGFGVAGARSAAGSAEGNGVTYPGVRDQADLQLEATPLGVKEVIVLKSADAPTVWDFPLDLQGVTAEVVDREVHFFDGAGEMVGRVPPGFMTDSNIDPRSGEAPRSDDVSYELVQSGGDTTLRVSVDPDWVAHPKRVFPVLVDPTVTSIDTRGDTYVYYPYKNDYSDESVLKIGTYDGGSHKAASLLKFNVSSVKYHKILGAKLQMYSIWSYSCNGRPAMVHPNTESWTVSGLKTWPGPSWGSEITRKNFAHGYSSSCGPRWVGFDVTGRVDKWATGKAPNRGLRVRASNTDSYGWKKFASGDSANPPYLDITHSAYWASYSGIQQLAPVAPNENGKIRVTVKNEGAETWTPTTYRLGYRLWDVSGSTAKELGFPQYINRPWVTKNVAHGQSLTMDVPIKKLPPGKYKLQFDMVKAGKFLFSNKGIPMSAPVTFTVPDVPPVVTGLSPTAGFQSDTRSPTLVMSADDPDEYPGTALQYRFRICNASGTGCTWSPSWSTSSSWMVPDDALAWGKDYLWYGRVSDGENKSDWTPGIALSTRVAQPSVTSHLGGRDGGGVDPAVGNFTMDVTDASVGEVGPDLSVARTYNSQDPRTDLAFGESWATAWDTKLEVDDDGSGNVVVTFSDGRQGRYGLNADGTYTPPPGQVATLVADGSSGWTLRDVGDVRYAFDASGALTSITDAAGHRQLLDRDAAGRLLTATDEASGRALSFTWSAGHVTKVTTGPSPALSWTYSYSGDSLAEACDPEGGCTSYNYGASPRYRSVVVDSNPVAYWRLGDTSETATSEIPGIWTAVDGTHVSTTAGGNGPITGDGKSVTAFDGSASLVRLPNGLLRGRSHASVELWFKTTSPGALFGTQNWRLGEGSGTESAAVLYVDANGKLRGSFPTGDGGTIVSSGVVNDDAWHHVALSGSGNEQTLYLDGTAVGSMTGLIDMAAMRHAQIGAAWTSGVTASPGTGENHFTGEIAEVALYHRPLGEITVAAHTTARTGGQKLASARHPGRLLSSTELTFDGATERVTEHRDANGGVWQLGEPVTSNEGTAANPDWRTTATVTDPAGDVSTYVYDPTRGGRVMSVTDGAGAKTSYTYDTGGFPRQITDPNGQQIEVRHDARGNEISRTQCRWATSGCYTSYREYFLNSDDPLDPRNDQPIVVRDARSASESDDTYATKYEYFPNGELKSVSVPGAADQTRVTTNTYTTGDESAVDGGTVPAWLPKATTEPNGAETQFAYTSAGDLARENDAAGLVTEYDHDGLGRVTAETVTASTIPNGATTTYTYDGAGRVVEEVEPMVTNTVSGQAHQQKTTTSYRPDGRVASVV